VDYCTGNKIGVTGFRVRDKNAEVGYLFLPEYHGFGYATESLTALIEYSKLHLGVYKFSAVVTQGNVASEKVLTKAGFVLDKVQRDSYMIAGKLYDDIFYKYA
jgi:RimJ/RimL family protein N-acetyltransferase